MLFVSKQTSQAMHSCQATPGLAVRHGSALPVAITWPSTPPGGQVEGARSIGFFLYHAGATARGCWCTGPAPTEHIGCEWDAPGHVCGFCEECHGTKGPGTWQRRLTCQGHLVPYEELVAQFQIGSCARPASDGVPSETLMHSWLVALTHVAPLLDRSCATLVDAVIELPWLAFPADVGNAWAHLVCAIVSARSEWVTRVVSLLFQNMGLRTLHLLTPQN